MKTLITGAARSVSDFGERARTLFEGRPLVSPPPIQKGFSKSRKPPPEKRASPAEAEPADGANRADSPNEE